MLFRKTGLFAMLMVAMCSGVILTTGAVHAASGQGKEDRPAELKGINISIGMIGESLSEGGDDVGPAREVRRMLQRDLAIVNLGNVGSYSWPKCQPNDPGDGPNVYIWPPEDEEFKLVPSDYVTSYVQIHDNTPSWLTLDTPRYWQKFEEFIEAMVIHMNTRYGEVHYIFENEPNSSRKPAEFQGNWADWYMHCLKHFYTAVHRANAKNGVANKVIAGNLAGRSAGGFRELYERGLKDYSDIIGDHPYPFDIRDGVAVWDLEEIRKVMIEYGDSEKQFHVREGWGSGRGAGFERSSPTIEPSAEEIENMWLSLVVGWDNFMTPREHWDPKYLYGAGFFCGNDNWGATGWRRRAEVVKDDAGNITRFVVDGYPQTPDIAPQFWNGGMMDWYGNSKDSLIHVFPGNGLVFMNSGFEVISSPPSAHLPHFWTTSKELPSAANCSVDETIFRGGRSSLRLAQTASGSIGVHQMSAKRSVNPGVKYRAGVWSKTQDSQGLAARYYMRFVSLDGSRQSDQYWAADQKGTGDWRRMTVEAVAPEYASRIEVGCYIQGVGTAWFDDVTIARADQEETGTIRGYTLDDKQNPVANCVVRTTSGGYQAVSDAGGFYEIDGVALGTYDVVCRMAGYVPHRVKNQTVAPGKYTFVSFAMGKPNPGLTVKSVTSDRISVTANTGVVNVTATIANTKSCPVILSDVGVFVEENGRDATGAFAVVASPQNARVVPADGEERLMFTLKPLPESAGKRYSINAYAFGQEDRPNLLRNGHFDGDDPVEHWNVSPEPDSTPWTLDATDFNSPPHSLRSYAEKRNDGDFLWAANYSLLGAQSVEAKPGQKYIVGAYHKDITKGRVDLNLFIEEFYYNGKDTLYNGRRFSAVPKRSVWTNDYFIYETGSPEANPELYPTNRLKISVGSWIRSQDGTSTNWWDDIYVKEEGDWLADDRADVSARLTVRGVVQR